MSSEQHVRLMFLVVGLIVAFLVARWAVVAYWEATHCTMVLGTRVCQ